MTLHRQCAMCFEFIRDYTLPSPCASLIGAPPPVSATWCLRYPVDEMITRVSADNPRHFSDIQIVSGLFKRPLHHTPAEGPQVAVVFARRAVAPLLRCASRKRRERSESRADGGRANGRALCPRVRPCPHGRRPPGASGRALARRDARGDRAGSLTVRGEHGRDALRPDPVLVGAELGEGVRGGERHRGARPARDRVAGAGVLDEEVGGADLVGHDET